MESDNRKKRDRLIGFAFAAGELLVEWDKGGLISFAEGTSRHLMAQDAPSIIGTSWRELFQPSDAVTLTEEIAGLLPGRRLGPLHLRLANGTAVALNLYRLPTGTSSIHCAISAVGASTDRISADRDTESGLLSADAFQREAGDLITSPKTKGRNARLTVVSIDGLAQWSRETAIADPNRSRAALRELGGELVSRAIDGLAGRVSPERFGIVHDVGVIVDEVRAAVGQSLQKATRGELKLVPAASSMPLSQPGLSPKEAMHAVRFALGRMSDPSQPAILPNRLDVAIDSMVQATVERMTVFQQAVRSGEMELAFQPIVDLKTGHTHHFEALVRLGTHPSPADSISFAEATGLAPELDLAVWSLALESLAASAPKTQLAINLSGRSLDDTATTRALLSLLEQTSVSKSRILLEITESAELRDLVEAENTIRAFRDIGVRICIDDFGAGAASLHYLRALSVDFLKLDGSYVADLGKSKKNMALVKAMAAICHDLGIISIAEHVETPAQAAILSDLGIVMGQGFLFGRPQRDLAAGEPVSSTRAGRTMTTGPKTALRS
jgi:EAL domain-containing protein (putative c-di-GMP-specific phosphodiesterase class I)